MHKYYSFSWSVYSQYALLLYYCSAPCEAGKGWQADETTPPVSRQLFLKKRIVTWTTALPTIRWQWCPFMTYWRSKVGTKSNFERLSLASRTVDDDSSRSLDPPVDSSILFNLSHFLVPLILQPYCIIWYVDLYSIFSRTNLDTFARGQCFLIVPWRLALSTLSIWSQASHL